MISIQQQITDELIRREYERRLQAMESIVDFTKFTFPAYKDTWYHVVYGHLLDQFIKGNLRKLMITMPPQHGKFFPADTPVLTTKGWKRHLDLSAEDYVFGEDGLPKKVILNSGGYVAACQQIQFSNTNPLICGKQHEWKLLVDYDNHKPDNILF